MGEALPQFSTGDLVTELGMPSYVDVLAKAEAPGVLHRCVGLGVDFGSAFDGFHGQSKGQGEMV